MSGFCADRARPGAFGYFRKRQPEFKLKLTVGSTKISAMALLGLWVFPSAARETKGLEVADA